MPVELFLSREVAKHSALLPRLIIFPLASSKVEPNRNLNRNLTHLFVDATLLLVLAAIFDAIAAVTIVVAPSGHPTSGPVFLLFHIFLASVTVSGPCLLLLLPLFHAASSLSCMKPLSLVMVVLKNAVLETAIVETVILVTAVLVNVNFEIIILVARRP